MTLLSKIHEAIDTFDLVLRDAEKHPKRRSAPVLEFQAIGGHGYFAYLRPGCDTVVRWHGIAVTVAFLMLACPDGFWFISSELVLSAFFPHAARNTTPAGTSPVVTRHHKAISNLRARATIIVLRFLPTLAVRV